MSEKFTYDSDVDAAREDQMYAVQQSHAELITAQENDAKRSKVAELAGRSALRQMLSNENAGRLHSELPPLPHAVPMNTDPSKLYQAAVEINVHKTERELATFAANNMDQLYDHAAIEANKDLRRREVPSRIITTADVMAAEAERMKDFVSPGGEVPVGATYNALADTSSTINLAPTTHISGASENLVFSEQGVNTNLVEGAPLAPVIPAEHDIPSVQVVPAQLTNR